MILGGNAIKEAFDTVWSFDGPELRIGPNSIDVSISGVGWKMVGGGVKMIGAEPEFQKDTLPIVVREDSFYLLTLREKIDCSVEFEGKKYVPMYEGRSSIARRGIGSHVTAGFGDYGFNGSWTLEVFNVSNQAWVLSEGDYIGQIYFVEVDRPKVYVGQYMERVLPGRLEK